ncbi:CDGSH iron-sulfur domain-containing protein [Streptomyces sp. NBC_01716]|uniref:CDGSH iron-sulfur domain-containing protein n=1 Tax=Streptomyces sp. NBC_01716 TaxID=2975917 RepID=UPI002E34B015|nr:CDGSH iron-sulfur domain-containing protein [Streptomyces sp. NBC_01716]
MRNSSEHPRPRRRRVSVGCDGPVLVEGPVEAVDGAGNTCVSNRFVVALCVCRRSRSYPWCDASHRRRVRGAERSRPADGPGAEDEAPEAGGPGGDDVP